jgi:hypothetical protein
MYVHVAHTQGGVAMSRAFSTGRALVCVNIYLPFYLGGDWDGVPAVSPRAFPVPGPAAEAGVPGGCRHAQVINFKV